MARHNVIIQVGNKTDIYRCEVCGMENTLKGLLATSCRLVVCDKASLPECQECGHHVPHKPVKNLTSGGTCTDEETCWNVDCAKVVRCEEI